MRMLLTGASGLIGSAVAAAVAAGGHRVTRLVRSGPGEGDVAWDPASGAIDAERLEGHDAAVHLAGESIAGRWTAAKKARILDSRVKGTALLSEALAGLRQPPAVLVSASAVGFYGHRGDEALTEESSAGSGFLPSVCMAWEAAAEPARRAGIRVVHPRFGVVLSRSGGALRQMWLPFRLGLGGPVGNGRQFFPWVALDDVVRAILHMLSTPDLAGPVNVVAPQPATNREFAKALGRALHRPALFRVPVWVIRLALGDMGRELLLASIRATPVRLLATGFRFGWPDLDAALRHVLAER